MMKRFKKFSGRIVLISIISAILDVIFHALLAPAYDYDYPPSYFMQNGLFQPAAALSLLIIFFLLGVVFLFIQENLPGSKLQKGTRFGVSFGGLWLIGVMGMTVFFGSPLRHELLGGACDCAALIILGVLLGLFTATDSDYRGYGSPVSILSAIIIISLVFIPGQYLAFLFMSGTPYFSISGLPAFIWTVILGVWVGVVYVLVQEGVSKTYSPLQRAIVFGGVVIGIDWTLFNLFVLLFVALPILDPLILSALNILSIIVGMAVFEALFHKMDALSSENL